MRRKLKTARVIVSALVVVLACVYGFMKLTANIQHALVVKTSASLCFVILGFMCFSRAPGDKRYCERVLSALIISLIGDVLLVFDETLLFLLGMAAFGTAQVFYILALWQKSKPGKTTILLFICLFAGTAAYLLFWPNLTLGKMLPPCMAYALMITLMLSMALTLPASRANRKMRIAIMYGACLFFISDFTLILEMFTTDSPAVLKLINSLTYYPAQMMFAYSMALNASEDINHDN